MQGNYLRTPHSGRTKASYVACPAPSPPSSFHQTCHQSPPPPPDSLQARYLIRFLRDFSSDFFAEISHQMSSRLLIQVSTLISCSDFSSENHRSAVETRSGSVIVRNALSQFLSCGSPARVFLGKSDLRSDFICCCNRGCLATARRGKHRIRRVHEVLSSGAAAT